MRAKEHAHAAIGILVNPHHGLDEVGPEPALRQLQPPAAPCDRVVVGDGSLFNHAQRLAPGLVPVGHERRAWLFGLDRKRGVVFGRVCAFSHALAASTVLIPASRRSFSNRPCSVPNIRSERPRASGEYAAANRKVKRDCDFALYCERNLIERFFNKIKHYRGIATRYDKLARNFLGAVQLAAAIILLN